MSVFRMFFFLVDLELVLLILSLISFAHRGLCTKAVTPVNTNEKTRKKSINSTKEETESKSEVLVPTSSDFTELRLSKAFVDKTDFLHEWLLYQPNRLGIVAPPGSGKSSLLSMVRHFCNASTVVHNGQLIHQPYTRDLFEGTMIAILTDFHNLHRRKYTVINVEFAPLRRATDRGSFERLFCAAMRGMVDDYRFLAGVDGLNETERNILQVHDDDCLRDFESAIRQYGPRLVGVLQKYLKNDVIVLADDIDAVLDVFATQDEAESFSDFAISTVKGFVSAFVANESQAPIASRLLAMSSFELRLILPGLLNHTVTSKEFDRSSRLGDYFGLTKPEIDELLAKYSLQDHSRMVTYLYDGHTIFKSPSVSNARAVLKYIQDHHRGISPTTETSNAILRDYERMFSDEWVGSAVTSCVFNGKVETTYIYNTRYDNILQLRQKVKKANHSKTNVQLSDEDREIFMRLLFRLGLLQISEDLNDDLNYEDLNYEDLNYDYIEGPYLAPTNNFNAAVLLDYHNTENLFKVRARDLITIVGVFKNLAPTSASVEKLKDALHGIVQMKDPESDINLKALVYTLARKAADYYSKNLVVDTGVVAYSTSERNALKSKGTPVRYGKREVLLVQKERNLGVVIVSRYSDTDNAASLLNEVTNKTYTDVFDTIPVFSKYNLKERMMIAVIVSEKAVDVYGEVHGSNGAVVRRMHHTSSRL